MSRDAERQRERRSTAGRAKFTWGGGAKLHKILAEAKKESLAAFSSIDYEIKPPPASTLMAKRWKRNQPNR